MTRLAVVIRRYKPKDLDAAAELLADFYHTMQRLKGRKQDRRLEKAYEDLSNRLERGEIVFVAETGEVIVGIQIISTDPICKLECVYVDENYRRSGIAHLLFGTAETFLKSIGEQSFYASVHPNNLPVIEMLRKNGYDVLNLLELRKRWPDQRRYEDVTIMGEKFVYEMGDLLDEL